MESCLTRHSRQSLVEISLTALLHFSQIEYTIPVTIYSPLNQKKESPHHHMSDFPFPLGTFRAFDAPLYIPIPMIKNMNHFFKKNLQCQQKFSLLYKKEASDYQASYNRRHPQHPIWRHMLYTRTFYVFWQGGLYVIRIPIVRFLFAGTSKTFSFYGSLFCAFSHYARPFIHLAISDSDNPDSPVSLTVLPRTLKRWAALPAGAFPPRSPAPDISA